MDFEALRRRTSDRIASLDPIVVDAALALALVAFAWLQLWVFMNVRPPAPPGGMPAGGNVIVFRGPREMIAGPWPYLLSAAVFLPLTLRRSMPWLALALTAVAATIYEIQPFPPTFTVLGPMIAVYSVAAFTRRRSALLALLVGGLIVAVPALAFSEGTRWIIQAVGTFALLAAAALLGDTTRNRREYIAEVEQRALEAERSREEEALRRAEEERIRIAREVHDIVAHSLAIVTVQASAAKALLETDPARAAESIDNVRATSKQALGELRSMLDVLRTPDTAPLSPAADLTQVPRLVEGVREAGLDVQLETSGDLEDVPAYAAVSGYRIIQEALTNVVRHAQAKHVKVEVAASAHDLAIEVTDDGTAPIPPNARVAGHGIEGMRERAEALGGTFDARPAVGGGFAVTTSIPLTRSAT